MSCLCVSSLSFSLPFFIFQRRWSYANPRVTKRFNRLRVVGVLSFFLVGLCLVFSFLYLDYRTTANQGARCVENSNTNWVPWREWEWSDVFVGKWVSQGSYPCISPKTLIGKRMGLITFNNITLSNHNYHKQRQKHSITIDNWQSIEY